MSMKNKWYWNSKYIYINYYSHYTAWILLVYWTIFFHWFSISVDNTDYIKHTKIPVKIIQQSRFMLNILKPITVLYIATRQNDTLLHFPFLEFAKTSYWKVIVYQHWRDAAVTRDSFIPVFICGDQEDYFKCEWARSIHGLEEKAKGLYSQKHFSTNGSHQLSHVHFSSKK